MGLKRRTALLYLLIDLIGIDKDTPHAEISSHISMQGAYAASLSALPGSCGNDATY